MARIHALACVEPGASIADDAEIGPFCVVGADATIGAGVRLVANVHVTGKTRIGPGTVIYPYASLGGPPQSLRYRGGATALEIGSHCDIRENVTINIATEDGGGMTRVGDRCFLMAGSHVAHDCLVGNGVILANNVALGGHVEVGDFAVFGGQSAVRQFTRIGEGAMIHGLSGVRADLIPFGLAWGSSAHLAGLNLIGLRRRAMARERIRALRAAYRLLFGGPGVFRDRVEACAVRFADDEEVQKVVAFIRSRGRRALTLPATHRQGHMAADGGE
ncbi:MAG: acyl-ACP--UDP-N-acetylglucosamine O-acyltransferase [Variibacter sp.]|nr:acyl-ACP--UDP-N-acetylglucosamine O-acyltransferase [Variibacter sp.]